MSASLVDLKDYEQREVEHGFAAACNYMPVAAISQCGWLDPSIIREASVRNYWEQLLLNINPGMTMEQAAEASAQAAIKSGLFKNLLSWSELVFYGATPQSFASEIVQRKFMVDVTMYATKLAQAVSSSDFASVESIIRELQQLSPGARIADNSSDAANADFTSAISGSDRSIFTGIGAVDDATGGLERQTEIIVAGRPSMGKTALALQWFRISMAKNKRAAFFSLEMSRASLWARAVCPTVGVDWRDVISGRITAAQRQSLYTEGNRLADLYRDYLYLDDGVHTTDSIWRAVSEFTPDIVFVDHLRLIRDRGDNEVKRQGLICERLKELAKVFNVPVVIVAQLSRKLEGRTEKRPTLADLRDSGEIEEHADLVFMIHSEAYFKNERKPDLIPIELWIRKFRNGPANVMIDLYFDAAREWFEPVGVQ